MMVRSGEGTFVQSGKRHRLENPGKVTLEVIEVQLGGYLRKTTSCGSRMSFSLFYKLYNFAVRCYHRGEDEG